MFPIAAPEFSILPDVGLYNCQELLSTDQGQDV